MNTRLTFVTSTIPEIAPLLDFLNKNGEPESLFSFRYHGILIDILPSGIGILHTAYTLMDYLSHRHPNGWIQAGIGGAFDLSLAMGQVYCIESELLIGTGAQDANGRIMDPFEMNWLDKNEAPYMDGKLICPYIPDIPGLNIATGMTTLHAHGNLTSIENAREHTHGQIENMEGAPFFYISLMKNIPFLSIRAVSNVVETRDKSKWKTDFAITHLNQVLIGWLQDKKILDRLVNLKNL